MVTIITIDFGSVVENINIITYSKKKKLYKVIIFLKLMLVKF